VALHWLDTDAQSNVLSIYIGFLGQCNGDQMHDFELHMKGQRGSHRSIGQKLMSLSFLFRRELDEYGGDAYELELLRTLTGTMVEYDGNQRMQQEHFLKATSCVY
jgi:hypothetical protein